MILYGIASAVAADIEDWYTSPERAEQVLAAILRDEPQFEAELWVQPVEFEQTHSSSPATGPVGCTNTISLLIQWI